MALLHDPEPPAAAKRRGHRGGRITAFGALGLAAWMSRSDLAHAQPSLGTAHDVELRYVRGPGSERCPDEQSLRENVLAHLGYDPFGAGRGRVDVIVGRRGRGNGLRAQIERVDDGGAITGARALDSSSANCTELAASIALAVSIAIDPLRGSFPHRTAPPGAALVAPPPPAPSRSPLAEFEKAPPDGLPRETAREEPSTPLRANVAAAVVTGVGASPSPAVGALFEARLRANSWSLGLGARADLPSSAPAHATSARIQSALLVGTVVPCVHVDPLALCISALLGSLAGDASNVAHTEAHSTFFAATGGRVAISHSVTKRFGIGAFAEVLGTLTPTTLRVDGVPGWSTAPVLANLAAFAFAKVP